MKKKNEKLKTKKNATKNRQLVTGAAPYLSHTSWHARVAAAACLESLARLECGEQRGKDAVTTTHSCDAAYSSVHVSGGFGEGVLRVVCRFLRSCSVLYCLCESTERFVYDRNIRSLDSVL